jgi:hypothetical protein
MSSLSISKALEFVAKADLPPPPAFEGREQVVSFDFNQAKNQAMIVGSDIISFVQGVTPDRRLDIVNSSLLAQLVAAKKVSDATDVFKRYEVYFDVLSNIGWVIQDRSFSNYAEKSDNFEAHEAILKVAAGLLGPASTTLALVQATLDAMKSMSTNSPWLTLFHRESQSANTARFQVSLVEPGADDQFLVALMAFGLKANAKLTQVLFFKFKSSKTKLKHCSGKVTINAAVLGGVRDEITRKISKFTSDYVRKLPDL